MWRSGYGFCFFVFGVLRIQDASSATSVATLDITPSGTLLVRPGQNLTVVCSSGEPLRYCRLTLPCLPPRLSLAETSHGESRDAMTSPENKMGDSRDTMTSPDRMSYKYAGKGLRDGECGITVWNVEEGCNGRVVCEAGVLETGEHLRAEMNLMVARSPLPPELYLHETGQRPGTSDYKERDMLHATCHVRDSRPPANITWYMGDDVITEGLSSPVYSDDAETALHSLSQDVTRYLTWRDDGVDLACVAGHVTSPIQNRTAVRLRVRYAPRFPEENVSPRFQLGKPATISVRMMANPRPTITWMFGDNVILREGSSDPEGRLFAVPTSDQGDSWYLTELRIERVRQEDIGLYLLLARNEAGVQTYHVFVRDQRKYPGTEQGRMSQFPLTYVASLVIASAIVAAMLLAFLLMCCEAFRQGRKEHFQELSQPIQMVLINGSSNPGPSTSTYYTALPTTEQETTPHGWAVLPTHGQQTTLTAPSTPASLHHATAALPNVEQRGMSGNAATHSTQHHQPPGVPTGHLGRSVAQQRAGVPTASELDTSVTTSPSMSQRSTGLPTQGQGIVSVTV